MLTGGPKQDFGSTEKEKSLFKKGKYSDIIQDYLKQDNPTAKKFFKKRLDWAKMLFETKEEVNILCADIVPWHTEKANGIAEYIANEGNLKTIKNLVLEPLMKISSMVIPFQGKSMQNKIIVRGVPFRNVINALFPKNKPNIKDKYIKNYIVLKRNGTLEEFISMLTVITIENRINKTNYKWYLFTGAPSNDLPLLEEGYKVYPVNEKVTEAESLISFLSR